MSTNVADALNSLSAYALLLSSIHSTNSSSESALPNAVTTLINAFLHHAAPEKKKKSNVTTATTTTPGGLLRAARKTGESHIRTYPNKSGGGARGVISEKDASAAQGRKDAERDVFNINGKVISGRLGFDHIISYASTTTTAAFIKEGLLTEHTHDDAVSNRSSDREKDLTAAFAAILTLANRTASGGDAYEATLLALELSGSNLLLMADTTHAAPPIILDIDVGSYLTTASAADMTSARTDAKLFATSTITTTSVANAFCWAERLRVGAKISIRATTCFLVVTDDPMPSKIARVTATWGCDVGLRPFSNVLDDICFLGEEEEEDGGGGKSAFVDISVTLVNVDDDDGDDEK